MAGIYNGPARGGTRGGRDQFNWENVRSDADREYYLGHSVKALTGRCAAQDECVEIVMHARDYL